MISNSHKLLFTVRIFTNMHTHITLAYDYMCIMLHRPTSVYSCTRKTLLCTFSHQLSMGMGVWGNEAKSVPRKGPTPISLTHTHPPKQCQGSATDHNLTNAVFANYQQDWLHQGIRKSWRGCVGGRRIYPWHCLPCNSHVRKHRDRLRSIIRVAASGVTHI